MTGAVDCCGAAAPVVAAAGTAAETGVTGVTAAVEAVFPDATDTVRESGVGEVPETDPVAAAAAAGAVALPADCSPARAIVRLMVPVVAVGEPLSGWRSRRTSIC
jgi:hypothetical protein